MSPHEKSVYDDLTAKGYRLYGNTLAGGTIMDSRFWFFDASRLRLLLFQETIIPYLNPIYFVWTSQELCKDIMEKLAKDGYIEIRLDYLPLYEIYNLIDYPTPMTLLELVDRKASLLDSVKDFIK